MGKRQCNYVEQIKLKVKRSKKLAKILKSIYGKKILERWHEMTKYKYKNVIKKGLKHTQKIYDEMTDWNEHGEAIRLICEYFEADKLVNIMEHINALHDLYGHLPNALGDLRNEVWEEIRPKYYKHFKGIDIKKY